MSGPLPSACRRHQALETPMYVDYTTGWQQFYEFSPTVIIILCLFACFLVSGIFSQDIFAL